MAVEIDHDQLREAWADKGLTLVDLGVRFGCSGETVANHARRLGLPPRPRGRRADVTSVGLPIGEPLTGGRWVPNGRGVMVWRRTGG